MDKLFIIDKTVEFVKNKMEGEGTGHDYWHIVRVNNLAKYIGMKENCDMFIVELAALLHDIGDWKFHGDTNTGIIENWLNSLNVETSVVEKVVSIIKNLSYKGGTVSSYQETIEGKVVQDADRLDAIGAIGIARTFAYGASIGREIYNPNILPIEAINFEQYKNYQGTTINHFYEKLLILKDKMNTETGKSIALKRHAYMEMYLEEFYVEWNGDDIC
ncbi:MAG: metal dependent phosphohydrolase [Haloplasmataceae bacterium]|jgi:uncharacterized protein|nr:metal dependent phosphohydrolase [Haloplasmataceae bacterium]